MMIIYLLGSENGKGNSNKMKKPHCLPRHHFRPCSASLTLQCTPQIQSHLQFTPFYLAGSLGMYIDVPPAWPFNTILSVHWALSQHNAKHWAQLFSLKLTRYFSAGDIESTRCV